eukprot:TRINITY_DN15231_c0_g1_i1.p1 TRINITY_DN15231_c0_g1~~TRINITY_DN15231_c0_g1_i1.p1  ORF type:complete len:372 (+),score=101.73 TRINITY_DN15231_c0_g1_i1:144-1259(+)
MRHFVVLWPVLLQFVLEHSNGDEAARANPISYCRWTDTRTGYVYDLSPLANIDADYAVDSPNASYLVNLCAPLASSRCQSTPSAVVCLVPPAGPGQAVATSTVYKQFSLPGQSGSSRGMTLSFGGGSVPDALFYLICLETGSIGAPVYTSSAAAAVAFVWQSVYACPTNTDGSRAAAGTLMAAPLVGGTVSFVMLIACCALCVLVCVRRCRQRANAAVAPARPYSYPYLARTPQPDPAVGPDVCILCRTASPLVSFASCEHKCCCASCVAKNGFICPMCAAAALRAAMRDKKPPATEGKEDTAAADEIELESMDTGHKISDCLVCLERPSDVVFIPCGHLCVCNGCSAKITTRCPYCNVDFVSKQTIFADL